MFNHIEIINDVVLEEKMINSNRIIALKESGVVFNIAETILNGTRYTYVAFESAEKGEPSDEYKVITIKDGIADQVVDIELLMKLFQIFENIIKKAND